MISGPPVGIVSAQYVAAVVASFPAVVSITGTGIPTNIVSKVINMPATVAAGDLLLMIFANESNGANSSIQTPAGWSVVQANFKETWINISAYAKVAIGTEGGTTVTVSSNGNSNVSAALVVRINNWFGALTGVQASALVTGAFVTTLDPASLTPSWGSAKTLWLVAGWHGHDDAVVSTFPTNYTGGTTQVSGGGLNDGASAAVAYRQLETATEDPGAMVWDLSESCGALTIAVRPA